ncbi:MAG: nucleotidyl transferase AbiEii/AbiGii toxin family protein [Acidimicrobiales bacterium]
MNGLFDAAEEVQSLCAAEGWRFCFIGGLAVQRWGEPRLTRDVDLTLITGFGDEASYVTRLVAAFSSRVDDPEAFARRTRVVLLRTATGVPVDIALGGLPFEERSVERSSAWPVPGIQPLRTCSAEDLVVHKVFAGRYRDWADVGGIVARQGDRLDIEATIVELEPLLEVKGASSDLERFLAMTGT